MLSSSMVPARLLSTERRFDALAAAALLAATATGAPIGLIWLGAGKIAIWRGGPGVGTTDLPSSDGFATRHLVPALAAAPERSRNLRMLSDHPDLHGIVGESVDGLVSAATSPIHASSGAIIGLVGAFDRVPREWSVELEQLDLVAGLLSQPPQQLGQLTATRLVADTVDAVERSLGSPAIQAMIDSAAHGSDPRMRRQASESQAIIDHVSLLRGRLRAALRSTPFTRSQVGPFDLMAAAERAVGEVTRRHGTTLPVSNTGSNTPVSGDVERAYVSISRAVAAGLGAVHPSDLTVGVSTRELQSDRLDGSIFGEVSISVKGAALGVDELTAIAAAFNGAPANPDKTSAVGLQVAHGETRFVAPGFEAIATGDGTWMTLRWPIDLG